jgi:N-sulfoglucosamine sulfohydrolase
MRLSSIISAVGAAAALLCCPLTSASAQDKRPNIFLAIADDWGYPHAGAYGDPVVKTPTFDRIAKEGVLVRRAFCSSPSCTPSRGALMTGQYHWRLEENANLHSTLQTKFKTYPEILQEAGYFIGKTRKAWGPGQLAPGGRSVDPAGPSFANFSEFLKTVPTDKPFCFWFGSVDPHRPYEWQSGAKSGMDLTRVKVPAALPDNELTRNDVADYFFEVQRFDQELGEALKLLEETHRLNNTIVVITGDHGMPFPRGKSNLYDLGAHVPLAIRWPDGGIKGEQNIEDFVSLTDLAPTFLEAAGIEPLPEMTGKSLLPRLRGTDPTAADLTHRDHVIYGKERHVPSQEKGNLAGYPSRALRNKEFLYIRNFRPELWPNGIPDASAAFIGNSFADCDNGPSKAFLIEHRDDPAVKKYFDLAFARRPAEELYDLKDDPEQLVNVAADPKYAEVLKRLSSQLESELRETGDPRIIGGGEKFDEYPYYGGPQNPAGRKGQGKGKKAKARRE